MVSRLLVSGALAVAGLTVFALPLAGQPLEVTAKRPVVVELYTSQGCSSCPAADALLGQLANRKDVLAVSLPVTYWDMLGWRDTLASEANTRRQKAYAKELGRGGVYTPQMIIDGTADVVGSKGQAVESAISARKNDVSAVAVGLAANKQQVRISIGAAPDRRVHDATIWLFGILPQATVSIGEGENSGRTVTYRNIVQTIHAVGAWKGQPVSVSLPRTDAGAPHDSIAVLVQQGGYGRVLGAALIDRPNYYFIR